MAPQPQQRRGSLQAPSMESLIPQIDPAVAAMAQRAQAQFATLGAAFTPEPDAAPPPGMADAMGKWQMTQDPKNTSSNPRMDTSGNSIVEGLVKRGMPQHIAEGYAMNAQDESGMNPSAIGDNGNAGGLFQMNGPRFRGLKDFAASSGRPWDDTETQLDHVMWENANGESGSYAKVAAARTRQEAAAAIVNYWERPAEEHRARREAAYLNS